MAPDPNEYWNYGSDEDFEDANRWTGTKFPPPQPAAEEAPVEAAAKAPVTSLAAAKPGDAASVLWTRAKDFGLAVK